MKYDNNKLRWLKNVREIEALPIKAITPEEEYSLMCSWFWNGIDHYPHWMKILPGELGYDLHYRYVIQQTPMEVADGTEGRSASIRDRLLEAAD